MIQVPMVLDRTAFQKIVDSMPDEEIETLVAAHPVLRDCLVHVHGGIVMVPVQAPVASSEPKAPNPAINKEALTERLLLLLMASPRLRAEDYAAKVVPGDYGATDETIGPAVKRILEGLVTQKKAYCEGERRQRRYWLAPPAAETPEAAE